MRCAWAVLLLLAAGPARAAPLDTVLAALAAEERAPAERVRLFVRHGDVADLYYIDRVRPDRTRLLKNPQQGGMEMVVIGNQQWLRTGTSWQRSAAPAVPGSVVPAMAEMFRQGLTDAVETSPPGSGPVVEGTMTWSGGVACTGRMHMAIDAGGRPLLFRFQGTCNDKPAQFRQAFSYPDDLTIEPP